MSSAETRINNPAIRFRPLDIATLAFIASELIIILIYMIGRPGWSYLLLFFLAAAGIVVLIGIFDLAVSGPFWKALRLLYPLFLFAFFSEAVGPQIFLVFDHPFDTQVIALEKMIFGVDPAFALQRYMEVWLNEIMSISHISYYLILPLSAVILLFKKRWHALERLVLTSALVLYVCYIIFIFYPVIGPRFFLSDQYYLPIIGPFFTPLMERILAGTGLYGAAMPSSHCAVALAALWILAREVPKTAILSFILISLICASEVYIRYQYISGVFAGLLIGAVVLWAAGSWQRKFDARIKKLTFRESAGASQKTGTVSEEILKSP